MMVLKSFTSLIGIAFAMAAHAQETEVELNPVTVTATLHPAPVSQTGRNVIVIEGSRFEKLPVNSLDELLRYVPGLEVQARGPMGTQSDFVLRGGTFQQVLVVLDGLRLNDPITGHFSSYIPIAPAEIERIEILKGASSAIYGSDAVGGVIHVITKTFARQKQKGLKKSATASINAGEWDLWNIAAGGHYRNKHTTVAGGLLHNRSDGQPLRGTRGFFNLTTASLSVNHYLNPAWQIGARAAWDRRTFGAQNYYTTSPADMADETVETFWNQLRLHYQKGANAFSLHGGLKNVEDDFRFNALSIPNNNISKLFQALALYEHRFVKNANLTMGMQFQNRRIKSNDRGNHAVKQAAAFAILQKSFDNNITVTPALRLDWDERSGTELIPQLNLSYKIRNFGLRGSAGKTIRQADFTERYNNYNRALVPNLNRVGNPDLAAETAFSYEIGGDWYAGKSLKIAATFFQRDYDDLIDFARTPYADMPRKQNLSPANTYFLAKNIESVMTRGVETDAVFSKGIGAGRSVFITWGAVIVKSKTGSGAPSLYLSSYAKFLTNFTASYAARRWSVSVAGLYKERDPQTAAPIKAAVSKDYFVMHAKAHAFVVAQKLALVAQMDNIFNRKYSDLLGAQMPGRWFMGGLKWSM